MQQVVINPAYNVSVPFCKSIYQISKGPIIIEEYMRKEKSSKSFSRMLSSWNKRYFVLNMDRKAMYYFPEKGAVVAAAREIPFDVNNSSLQNLTLYRILPMFISICNLN